MMLLHFQARRVSSQGGSPRLALFPAHSLDASGGRGGAVFAACGHLDEVGTPPHDEARVRVQPCCDLGFPI